MTRVSLAIIAALLASSLLLLGAIVGLWPADPPACGTGTRPEGMCVFSSPDERQPLARDLLAGSVSMTLVGYYLWRRRTV
ncbi:hypothetical protein J2S40_001346 [Nocardioides luteus]|uniref:Uncharacterized protein n=1 Tax=Nocardioides luteus TaxID=1844 RepID=A0ABQ5T207_9ACTN|nr:hypothetical protein [Nocardioides luteus]MDR7310288.1 hypothetical protein [Nocardioides luteus]GGR53696.1 hypothetical protein GCM10010197_20170 [Nocardioides luteus]GLJ69933.1 hypothetical protein GCM10017579_39690 [Nocardioides luteus]